MTPISSRLLGNIAPSIFLCLICIIIFLSYLIFPIGKHYFCHLKYFLLILLPLWWLPLFLPLSKLLQRVVFTLFLLFFLEPTPISILPSPIQETALVKGTSDPADTTANGQVSVLILSDLATASGIAASSTSPTLPGHPGLSCWMAFLFYLQFIKSSDFKFHLHFSLYPHLYFQSGPLLEL